MNESSQELFCYLTINNDQEVILYCCLIGLSFLLLIVGVRNLYQMRGSHNRSTAFVYSVLFIWFLTFGGTAIFAAWLYQFDESAGDQELSKMSRALFFLDWVNAYSLQLLALYLPYRWSKNINILFNGNGPDRNTQDNRSSDYVSQSYAGVQTKIQPLLLWVIKIRFFLLGVTITFLFFPSSILFRIAYVFLPVDCLISIASLILGVRSLKKEPELVEYIDEEQSTRIINQYLIMMLGTFVRLAIDSYGLYFILKDTDQDFYSPQCKFNTDDLNWGGIIRTAVLCIFGDFFIVFIILRIFTLEEKPEEICKSLIITANAQGGSTGLLTH